MHLSFRGKNVQFTQQKPKSRQSSIQTNYLGSAGPWISNEVIIQCSDVTEETLWSDSISQILG